MCVELTLNKANVVMEVDTGLSVSLLSESTYRRLWTAATRPPLLPSDARLHTYSGELIKFLGTTSVTVRYSGQVKQLPLLIVPTDGPSLLGRDWLQEIVLDWKQLNKVHYARQRALQDVLDKYADLFKPRMGMHIEGHYRQDPHSRKRPSTIFPSPTRTLRSSRQSYIGIGPIAQG